MYDEMVKNFPIFCLIPLIIFAYIKQKWRFRGLKWVMVGMSGIVKDSKM